MQKGGMRNVYSELKEFMFTSNMARASASFAIGSATADFAKVITFSLLIPCIQMAWGALTFGHSTAANDLDMTAVVEHLLLWFCVIFVAYFLAEMFFSQGMLGIKTTIDDKDKQRLKVAEDEADKRVEEIVQVAETAIAGASDGVVRQTPNLMPFSQ
jgi:hypothetical protein